MFKKENPSFIIAFLLVALAFVESAKTIDVVLMPRFLYTTIGIFILGIFIWFRKDTDTSVAVGFVKSKWSWPFFIFLIPTIVSAFSANTQTEAWFSIAMNILFFILMLFTLVSINGELLNIENVVKAIIVLSLIFGIIGLRQLFLQGFSLEDTYDLTSTLGHRNLFASAILLGLFYGVYGIFKLNLFWKIVSAVSVFLSLYFLFVLQSRSAVLALAVGIFSFFALSVFENRNWNVFRFLTKKVIFGLGVILVLIFSGVFLKHKIQPIQPVEIGKQLQSETQKSYTVKERSLLWENTIFMALDGPYFGNGAGNWKVGFPKYGSGIWRARQGMVQFQRPHNDYLWVLAESGIIALAGYLLMFLVVIKLGWSLLFNKKVNKHFSLLIKLALSAILAYMVVAFFSFPKERIAHQWLLFTSFAIVISVYFRVNINTSVKPKNWIIGASILIIPMVWMGVERVKGEGLSKQMMNDKANSHWIEMLHHAKEANALMTYSIDPVSMPIGFYEGLADLNLKEQDASLKSFENALVVHPYNIHVVNNVAGIYQMRKQFKKSIEYYELSIKIAPYYKDGILNLCGAYFNNNQVNEAYNVLVENHEKFEVNHQVYEAYLTTILNTLYLNWVDSKVKLGIRLAADVKTDWLLECHLKNIKSNKTIEEIFNEKTKFVNP